MFISLSVFSRKIVSFFSLILSLNFENPRQCGERGRSRGVWGRARRRSRDPVMVPAFFFLLFSTFRHSQHKIIYNFCNPFTVKAPRNWQFYFLKYGQFQGRLPFNLLNDVPKLWMLTLESRLSLNNWLILLVTPSNLVADGFQESMLALTISRNKNNLIKKLKEEAKEYCDFF